MKSKARAMFMALSSLALVVFATPAALAQGSLTPPGAPGPTMLTLNQIEPRIPISSPSAITAPGSYYLTTNLVLTSGGSAISILTNDVTLDLAGFTISSTASATGASSTGIFLSAFGISDITIFNGHIVGGSTNNNGTFSATGFATGIGFFNSPNIAPVNIRVSNVSVSGCRLNGIYLGTGNSSLAESCTVQTIGGNGITAAEVSHSTALICGGDGIIANNASDCYGYSIGASGIYVSQTAANCYGYSSNSDGLDAGNAINSFGVSTATYSDGVNATCNANNCNGSGIDGVGLYAGYTATGCSGSSINGTGLSASCANNCYGTSSAGTGLNANYAASGCYGQTGGTGIGLGATTALNCQGVSAGGDGISASDITIGCVGISPGGIGIFTAIANSCYSSSSDGHITHTYNMP